MSIFSILFKEDDPQNLLDETVERVLEFNPYHGWDGKFSSSDGGSAKVSPSAVSKMSAQSKDAQRRKFQGLAKQIAAGRTAGTAMSHDLTNLYRQAGHAAALAGNHDQAQKFYQKAEDNTFTDNVGLGRTGAAIGVKAVADLSKAGEVPDDIIEGKYTDAIGAQVQAMVGPIADRTSQILGELGLKANIKSISTDPKSWNMAMGDRDSAFAPAGMAEQTGRNIYINPDTTVPILASLPYVGGDKARRSYAQTAAISALHVLVHEITHLHGEGRSAGPGGSQIAMEEGLTEILSYHAGEKVAQAMGLPEKDAQSYTSAINTMAKIAGEDPLKFAVDIKNTPGWAREAVIGSKLAKNPEARKNAETAAADLGTELDKFTKSTPWMGQIENTENSPAARVLAMHVKGILNQLNKVTNRSDAMYSEGWKKLPYASRTKITRAEQFIEPDTIRRGALGGRPL